MPVDRRVGTKINKALLPEASSGMRVSPYPYVGIVKNNVDPNRMGRLWVWIPDLGGSEDDTTNWLPVSHASPYMGSTVGGDGTTNTYENNYQSYGMWFVPPDLENEVLVTFVGGDTNRGYWFACVNSSISRYMMPAGGGSRIVDPDSIPQADKAYVTTNQLLPVGENSDIKESGTNVAAIKKPFNQRLFSQLLNQGLDNDTSRGVITSSSQRETPSNVFGINTPGRPTDDTTDHIDDIVSGLYTVDAINSAAQIRNIGHSFVMDDGAITGIDNLIRFRTSAGHQILLNDTEQFIYISHCTGNSWIEMTADGQINVYSSNGAALNTGGTLNLRAESGINIETGGAFNVSAGSVQFDTGSFTRNVTGTDTVAAQTINVKGDFNVDATTTVSLKSSASIMFNSGSIQNNPGGGIAVNAPKSIPTVQLPNTLASTSKQWKAKDKALTTIVTVAPTHEPFAARGPAAPYKAVKVPPTNNTPRPAGIGGAHNSGLPSPGAVGKVPTDKDLRLQPSANGAVGPLTLDETTALFAYIAARESRGQPDNGYGAVNPFGYLGKYQMGYGALVDAGLCKAGLKAGVHNSILTFPDTWKNNLSKEAFLASHDVQEQAMLTYTQKHYTTLVYLEAINIADDNGEGADTHEYIGGALAAAHLLGPGAVSSWVDSKFTVAPPGDANGTQIGDYWNTGMAAIQSATRIAQVKTSIPNPPVASNDVSNGPIG